MWVWGNLPVVQGSWSRRITWRQVLEANPFKAGRQGGGPPSSFAKMFLSAWFTMCIANSWATGAWYLPCGRVHDAASFLRSHSAAAAPFECVMVHSEVVAQLMCQGHCGTKGAVWMVLKENTRAEIYSLHLLGLFLPIFPPFGICSSLTLGLTQFPRKDPI